MSEPSLWQRTRDNLKPFGRLVRVENPIDPGTPDVCYCLRRLPTMPKGATGWIELKHVHKWPVRSATALVINELTREQVDWHTFWALAGGTSWCLLQVDRTILLLDHHAIAQVFARAHTRTSLSASAAVVSENVFPTAELVKCLTRT